MFPGAGDTVCSQQQSYQSRALKNCPLYLGTALGLPPMPGTILGQMSDTGVSWHVLALEAGR